MRALLMLAAATAIGCGASGGSGAAGIDAPPVFIAFTPDFQPFRSWPSFHSDGPAPGTVPDDVLGPREQYVNHVPVGASAFPIGTIVVEARQNLKIFAGVKRGGGYNATGAINWEWFELLEAADGSVAIVWRGIGAPIGDSYGGDPNGCNSCHRACADNDYVCSPVLQLGSFR